MFETHGFSKVDTAKKCFAENLRNLGRDSEKYNLYNGLTNLSSAVEEMQAELAQIRATLAHIVQRLP